MEIKNSDSERHSTILIIKEEMKTICDGMKTGLLVYFDGDDNFGIMRMIDHRFPNQSEEINMIFETLRTILIKIKGPEEIKVEFDYPNSPDD